MLDMFWKPRNKQQADKSCKASNNKKMNFSRKKLDDRITRLDNKIKDFFVQIEENDKQEIKLKDSRLKELQNLLARKEEYQGYLAELDATGENEKSIVDPEARLMGKITGAE